MFFIKDFDSEDKYNWSTSLTPTIHLQINW